MNKKVAIKIIENEINIILKELKINYVISFDNEDKIGFDDYNFDEYTPAANAQITYSSLGKISGAASFSGGYLQKQSTSTGASSAVSFSA